MSFYSYVLLFLCHFLYHFIFMSFFISFYFYVIFYIILFLHYSIFMSFYFLDHFVIFWGYVFQCLALECITSKALAVCYSIFMFFYFHIILFLRYSIFMSFYFLDHFVIFWGYAFQCLALECITSKPLAVWYSIFLIFHFLIFYFLIFHFLIDYFLEYVITSQNYGSCL